MLDLATKHCHGIPEAVMVRRFLFPRCTWAVGATHISSAEKRKESIAKPIGNHYVTLSGSVSTEDSTK